MRIGFGFKILQKNLKDALRRLKPYRSEKCREEDVHVYYFPQTWGGTQLGFGGIGGAAITTAPTLIVCGPSHDDFVVYFGGRFAYYVTDITSRTFNELQAALKEQYLPSIRRAKDLGWLEGALSYDYENDRLPSPKVRLDHRRKMQ